MIYHSHIPSGLLGEFVEQIWYFEGERPLHAMERVLPTGTVELVINLREDAIRCYDPHDPSRFETLPGALIAGPRSEFMVIDTASQEEVIGVHFKAGGAFPFLGLPVCEVGEIDLSLDALWGSAARSLRERLLEAPTVREKFAVMEDVLLARIAPAPGLHRAVTGALRELAVIPSGRSLAAITADTGLSQRRFIELFSAQVGLTPKRYHRVRRFQEALGMIERGRRVEWTELALACGYYDQPHFIRDFRAFSGINPSEYVAVRGPHFNHVPLVG
jgi:AraC-like DNA-binding protein